ncbi:hypothetical protein E2P81_ATG09435 [Venturia nashicola]|uniref:Cell surface protein n=1 Tax=Venturia nashicola TaxID=86259 RepID=A0A4Z1P731_9PEZI|nr:hypothetical protein E6O75_ATG09644 [Venturia nashicola]TLD25778.1 hypothetical protein E2P81_ATG09435 [Venturia nashicola]
MDKVKQVVDKIVHPKDHSSSTPSTGDPTHTGNHTSTTGTHTGTTGHSSGVTGTHAGTTGHSTGVTGTSGGAGPHNSSMLNKADPTVDSDFDGSRNLGAAQHGPGGVHNHNQQHAGGLSGTNHSSGLTGANHGSGLTGAPAVTGTQGHAATGPHSSNLANKLDPRVKNTESTLPGSHNQHSTGVSGGNYGTTGSSGLTGSHNQHTTGSGVTGGYGTSTNAGPHNSNALNSIDPRVDSDGDASRNLGAAQYGPGGVHNQATSGLTGSNHGTAGSGLTGGATGSGLTGHNHGTTGSGLTGNNHSSGLTGTNHGTHGLNDGPAPNTAGAHKSDMLNKLDPRIDSDLDGSKTVGKAPPTQQY